MNDVILLNAQVSPYIRSRLYEARLYYNMYENGNATMKNFLDIGIEGNTQPKFLSNMRGVITEDNKVKCVVGKSCVVIRPFYEDENHNAVFNYSINNHI